MNLENPKDVNVPIAIQRKINDIANTYEDGWDVEAKQNIGSLLEMVESRYQLDLLKALVEVDVELRMREIGFVQLDDYEQFKELSREYLQGLINEVHSRLADVTSRSTRAMANAVETPPDSIDGYKLLQAIGEGGMGTVWMAQQEVPIRRRVAVKLIREDKAGKEAIARFEAERQAIAMMDHQNIAKVYDAGETNSGQPYFVMELVKGVPINKYCDQNKLSVHDRLELFVAVCKAVQHAHQKGIIHRDLKPSNVLVTILDGRPIAKVIDFGLAKAIDHTTLLTDKTMFTRFGDLVGTLQYMSPEQAESNQLDIDTRTDIYSLGVVLYELLTGTTPLDKKTMGEKALLNVLELIRESDLPRPSTRLSSIGESLSGISEQRNIAPSRLQQILRGELDWVVMKALEKDRTRRYASAQNFADDIERYLKDEPVVARPPSTVYKLQKFFKKNRGLVASIATITLLLVVGLVGTTYGLALAQKENARANELNRELAESNQLLKNSNDKLSQANGKLEDSEKQIRANFEQTRKLAFDLIGKAETDLSRFPKLAGIRRWMTKKAVEVFEEIRQQHLKDPNFLSDLGQLYKYLANLSKFTNDFETASKMYSKSIDCITKSLELDGSHRVAQDRLAEARRDYASLLKREGDLAEALDVLESNQQDLRKLRSQFPDSISYKKTYATNLIELSVTQVQRLQLENAIRSSSEATGILTELADAKSATPIDTLLLVIALDDKSVVLRKLGRMKESAVTSQLARERLELNRESLKAIPAYKFFVARVNFHLAQTLSKTDPNSPEIKDLFEIAESNWSDLTKSWPDDADYVKHLADLFVMKARMSLDRSPKSATEYIEKAISFAKTAVEKAVNDVSIRETLVNALYVKRQILEKANSPEQLQEVRNEYDKQLDLMLTTNKQNLRLMKELEELGKSQVPNN